MESIVDNLRTLQALAINAANDTNTDDDRAVLQKEIDQRLDEINSIASHTNFNGKYLLNGDYGKRTTKIDKEISAASSIVSDTSITFSTEVVSTTATVATTTQVANTYPVITQTLTANVGNLTEPTGTAITVTSLETYILPDYREWMSEPADLTVTKITTDGVYDLKNFSGNLYVNAENVKLTNTGGTLTDVRIIDGGSLKNLWLDNININVTQGNKSVIEFSGADKVLCLCDGSTNTFTLSAGTNRSLISVSGDTNETGLTITGNGTLKVLTNDSSNSAMIGSNYAWSCGGITIDSGVTLEVSSKAFGAAIGSGQNGSCGDIKICSGATVKATADGGAAIGSGGGSDNDEQRCGKIYIYSGANVTASSNQGAAIGAGVNGRVNDIYIYEGATVTVGASSKVIGAYDSDCCNYVYHPSSGITCTDGSAVEYRAVNTNSFITINTTTTVETTTTIVTTSETVTSSTLITTSTPVPTSTKFNNVYFQWGAKANQSTALSINDMHTKSLRGEVPSRTDTERLNAMDKTSDEYKNFIETLKAASSMTLDDISVGTRENANVAICVINGALEYALDVSTTLGAHSSRMEFATLNITTMSENVQASESVIRDADMATAMTGYTKANVLRQAAQSMLAQANQNGANVLSLLKQ